MLSVPRNITKQSNGPAQSLIRMNVLVTWSEKQRLSRIWKWTKIKSLIAIFSGFFCSEFLSKCTANSLQKFNPSDFRKPEQKCHFAFFDVFGKVTNFVQFKCNLYCQNEIPFIWEQPVQISSKSYWTAAFGGLKRVFCVTS